MPTALVLSGGGSRGNFQVGAVRYLYERGVRPSIIGGCSVGALNGAKLAESADPMQAILGLEGLWDGLQRDSDMWEEEQWVTQASQYDLGHRLGESFSRYWFNPPFALTHFIYEAARDAIEIKDGLERAQSLLNLGPIRRLLQSGLSPEKVRQSGIKLRVAIVGLESGKLRYITESGEVLERQQNKRVMGRVRIPSEACRQIADELAAMMAEVSDPVDALGSEPMPRLRRTEFLDLEIVKKEQELRACMAEHPGPGMTVNLRDGVLASASIPVAFPPVRLGHETYVDGGVREMLPIEAALDAGADEVFAIVTTAGGVPTAKAVLTGKALQSFATANLADITKRVAEEIMPDETLFAETNPPGGWGASVTLIQPALLPEIHQIMTIDPGLNRIQMAHGYMRADDVLQARARARQESPDDPGAYLALANQLSEERRTHQIVRVRAAAWRIEHALHGQPVPGSGSKEAPPSRSWHLDQLRSMKRDLRRLVEERRRAGGALPAGADQWWYMWEPHPWKPMTARLWDDRGATFVRQTVPARMTAGRRYDVSVTMRNNGVHNWTPGGTNPYRLGSQNPQDNRTWGLNRVELTAPVGFEHEATFRFSVTAPTQTGTHNFRWRMLQEQVAWFGDLTPNVAVQVVPPQLSVSVQPYPVPTGVSTRVTVRAVDADSGAPVAGQVLIDGVVAGQTNTPFDYTFRLRTVRGGTRLEPTLDFVAPTGVVRASGYPEAALDFGIVGVA